MFSGVFDCRQSPSTWLTEWYCIEVRGNLSLLAVIWSDTKKFLVLYDPFFSFFPPFSFFSSANPTLLVLMKGT